jgi:tRNA-2-methylthio-N6-dimethylallyladenosine synthase
MARKLYIKTFGCQMNEYDSAKMADVLAAAEGMEITADPGEADVIVFNTCSVREKAQEKVFHDLGRVKHLKLERPHLMIGVGGCVASQEGAAIVARAPYVDVVFGPQTLHRLPALLAARRRTGKAQVDISFPEIEKFDSLPPARVAGVSAFVSIMEGCSKYCSFCVVPYTRGEEVSRPLEDVLTEVAELALAGVKEITLLGQNVNAYRGKIGRGARVAAVMPGDAPDNADFALLLEYVAEIPGLDRIRYTTSHPREFTQRLIDAYIGIPKLAGHVHLPVQSGSDRVLAAMKRGYTTLEYKSIVRRLRAARPDISISSDFIVGFPGETDRDFDATMQLIADVGFDDSYSFLYSPRPGTPAAELRDDTPQPVKQARLARLQDLIEKQARAINQSMVGSTQRVLVEGAARRDASELCGRSDSNRMVNFAGAPELAGRMVDITITAALTHSLRGECRVPPPGGECRVPSAGGECRVSETGAEIRTAR